MWCPVVSLPGVAVQCGLGLVMSLVVGVKSVAVGSGGYVVWWDQHIHAAVLKYQGTV